MILPRQARDKHRESTQKQTTVLSQASAGEAGTYYSFAAGDTCFFVLDTRTEQTETFAAPADTGSSASAEEGGAGEPLPGKLGAKKRAVFLRRVLMKHDHLPGQARDKHQDRFYVGKKRF